MKPSLDTHSEYQAVVFFDGVCGLCNTFVDFLLKVDTKKRLRFSPLQGKTFQKCCENAHFKSTVSSFVNQSFSSVFYWEPSAESPQTFNGRKVWTESDAAIRTLGALGGIWSLVWILRVIPKGIRNSMYKFIAKNRYKWFGKKDVCRIPSEEEQKQFLP